MRWGILLIVLSVVGCYHVSVSKIPEPLTVDGTSEDTFTKSVDAMREELPVKFRKPFEVGMQVLGSDGTSSPPNVVAPVSVHRSVRDNLHGKTAKELIDAGAAHIAEIEKVRQENDEMEAALKNTRDEEAGQQQRPAGLPKLENSESPSRDPQ